ncbi:MAG: hypothetical protein BZY66_01000, partial [SAR202 cluster bacterium Ae2-Chloro-G3]
MEYRVNQRGLRAGVVRYVHEPGWISAFCPFLRGLTARLDLSALFGYRSGGALLDLHLALSVAEERSEPRLN